jgi:membrane protein DedA with SNARE-associated domain
LPWLQAGTRESGNFGIQAPPALDHRARAAHLRKAHLMSATPLPGLLGAVAPVLDNYGYLAVAGLILLENFGVPAPGETILVAASVYAGTGRLSIVAVGVIAVLAAAVGNCIGYAIGYFGGHALVLRFGRYVMLTPERLDKAERFFERRGGLVVVAARFFEGLRQVAGIIAGTAEMPFRRFVAYTTIGAVLWVALWAPLGYLAGDHIGTIYTDVVRYSLYLLIALAVLAAAWVTRAVLRRRRRAAAAEPGSPPDLRKAPGARPGRPGRPG